jgi:UPF0716 protein FxsA
MAWIVGLLLFLVVPWVEFWLMMELGFSLVTATALGVATAAAGWWLSRGEGLGLWTELESDVQNGRVPTAEALDAMMVVIGGWGLIIPGLLTDMVGAVLLVPAIRRLAMEPLRRWIRLHLL